MILMGTPTPSQFFPFFNLDGIKSRACNPSSKLPNRNWGMVYDDFNMSLSMKIGEVWSCRLNDEIELPCVPYASHDSPFTNEMSTPSLEQKRLRILFLQTTASGLSLSATTGTFSPRSGLCRTSCSCFRALMKSLTALIRMNHPTIMSA